MAPERLFFEPQSPISDVFSLSMTLFEMIAGKPIRRVGNSEQEHDKRIRSYCKKLLSPMKVSPEIKEALYLLLTEGLTYESTKRLSAEEFSKRTGVLAQSMQGIEAIEWSEKIMSIFVQQIHRDCRGDYRGKFWEKDTQIYTKMNDDSTIRDEVDAAIMRRGAQMGLSMDTQSLRDLHRNYHVQWPGD